MKYLLDSNILIALVSLDIDVLTYLDKQVGSEIYVSVLTLTEVLWHKNITCEEQKYIEELLRSFKIVEVDEKIARLAIKYRQEYKLKTIDGLIAATAESIKAKLLTRDKDILKVGLKFAQGL